MEKRSRKNDLFLFGIVVFAAVMILFVQMFMKAEGAGCLIVRIGGEVTATYSLETDQEFSINNGTNRVRIRNGEVCMIEADCPDQICVNHKAISKNHESIICLPNKISLEIVNEEQADVDATTN